MQVQSIINNRMNTNFSADANTEKAKAFVNMNDSQLKTLAYLTAHDKKTEKTNKKTITSTLYALPVAASLSTGILRKGKLGTKTVAATAEAGRWGFALLVLAGFNAVKNAVTSRSKKLQNFENNNPIISTVADIGLFVGALTLGNRGVKKAASKIVKKAPEATAKLFTKLQNTKRIINKSVLNKKVLPSISKGIDKLAKKAPWAVAAGTAVIANSVLIIFIAGLARGNNNEKQIKKNVERNYVELKKAQLQTAKQLANAL